MMHFFCISGSDLRVYLIVIVFFFAFFPAKAQTDSNSMKIKTGWTLGAAPALAFDSDLGYRYGGLVNLYYYGDGSNFPNYKHSLFLEISHTTKGSGTNQLFYDSKYLLPRKTRLTADLSYLTEQAVDFYGFNGYQAAYIPAFEETNDKQYISRMYYRHERKMLRFTADIQNKAYSNLRWLAGFGLFKVSVGSVDIQRLNKGKKAADLLPDTASLYDKYVNWGFIPSVEANGGTYSTFKTGLVWDTRDQESNPSKGLWTELLFVMAPSFINKNSSFTRMVFIHRQYHSLIREKCNLALRVAYQGTVAGRTPFSMTPYLFSSYSPFTINEGLGGAKSVRGMLRNRVVGQGVAYGNFELRYKFLKAVFLKQNIYLAFNVFSDAGMVVIPQQIDKSMLPPQEVYTDYFDLKNENCIFVMEAGYMLR